MALKIAMAGQKGGIGKSTVGIALAAEWHRRGKRVLFVDADDEQRTALTWSEVAAENGHDSPRTIALGDNIRTTLPALLEDGNFDVVIIDTPGRNGRRTTFALGQADVALFPCGPTGPDIWAMDGTLKQALDVAAVHEKLDLAILITRKQPGTVIGRRARVTLDEAEVPVLDTELEYRVTYGEAITGGQGLGTYAPKSEAAGELGRLIAELERRYGLASSSGPRRASPRRRPTPPTRREGKPIHVSR